MRTDNSATPGKYYRLSSHTRLLPYRDVAAMLFRGCLAMANGDFIVSRGRLVDHERSLPVSGVKRQQNSGQNGHILPILPDVSCEHCHVGLNRVRLGTRYVPFRALLRSCFSGSKINDICLKEEAGSRHLLIVH